MESLVKRLPMPIVGLMLALAAAGNLVQSYGEIYRTLFGLASSAVLLLVILKIIIYPSLVKEELKNPVVASVFPTLTMALMLLATYLKPISENIAFGIWILALIGHGLLILSFSFNHLIKFDLKKVFPSWFIVYVGIVVGSVTAPAFEMQSIGRVLFWLGLLSYFLVLAIVLKRLNIHKIAEPALPTIAIFAAPVALCLAGYMNSFASKNMIIVWALLILSQLSYFFVLGQLPKLLKSKFYPSFSGFTFPVVISAISIKLTNGYLVQTKQAISVLQYLAKFEELLALIIVVYVLIKYLQFLLRSIWLEDKPSGLFQQ